MATRHLTSTANVLLSTSILISVLLSTLELASFGFTCLVRKTVGFLWSQVLRQTFFLPQNIPRVASLGVECVSSFALDYWLQTHLFQAGVLWYLLGYLFNYDYTLEESGIQKSEDSNHQVILTRCMLSNTKGCCLPSLINKIFKYLLESLNYINNVIDVNRAVLGGDFCVVV